MILIQSDVERPAFIGEFILYMRANCLSAIALN
jgi:hypothetical protein